MKTKIPDKSFDLLFLLLIFQVIPLFYVVTDRMTVIMFHCSFPLVYQFSDMQGLDP